MSAAFWAGRHWNGRKSTRHDLLFTAASPPRSAPKVFSTARQGSSLVLRATSSRLRRLFESSKVLEHIAGVAAEDGPADEPVKGAEDRAPRVSGELAGPDHLDAASTLTRRCAQLPSAPRH